MTSNSVRLWWHEAVPKLLPVLEAARARTTHIKCYFDDSHNRDRCILVPDVLMKYASLLWMCSGGLP